MKKNLAYRTSMSILFILAMTTTLPGQAETKTYQIDGEIIPFAEDGIRDPEGPMINVYQHPSEALAKFPRDSAGIIDWAKAMDMGLLIGRVNVTGTATKETKDLDIIMKNTGDSDYVKFPHRQHTLQMDCSNCHPSIFAEKAGSTKISMDDIYSGNKCGMCHGTVAFPPKKNCERCHSQKK